MEFLSSTHTNRSVAKQEDTALLAGQPPVSPVSIGAVGSMSNRTTGTIDLHNLHKRGLGGREWPRPQTPGWMHFPKEAFGPACEQLANLPASWDSARSRQKTSPPALPHRDPEAGPPASRRRSEEIERALPRRSAVFARLAPVGGHFASWAFVLH